MTSTAIVTATKMIESLPETTQNQVVEHLYSYIEGLQDEIQWDITFKKTQRQLVTAAQHARKEIAKGYAKPMDYNQL